MLLSLSLVSRNGIHERYLQIVHGERKMATTPFGSQLSLKFALSFMQLEILVILISLFFSAFFSGIEIAFISASRLKIELANQNGSKTAQRLLKYVKNPSKFIITSLIGNNIALVIFSLGITKLLEPRLIEIIPNPFLVMLIPTLITTMIILFVGEFIPKAIFRVFANQILNLFAIPIFFFTEFLFAPIRMIVNPISKLCLRLFGIRVSLKDEKLTAIDLEQFIKEHMSSSSEEENEINTELFENALYLEDIKVRECAVPRPEIAAIEVNSSLEELKNLVIETTHSRIIVFKDSIDNVLGYVHHFDLHKRLNSIADILLPIMVVPETMGTQDLLNKFIKEGKNIAWVVDEYGGTAGVITMEDILEEIFGEIRDEYDEDEFIDEQLAKDEYILSGRLEVDHLNDQYNMNIPDGDYETLSGFIVDHLERIPENGEKVVIDQYTFKIMDVSDKKIETVKLNIENNSAIII